MGAPGSGGRPSHAAGRPAGQLPHPGQPSERRLLHVVLPRQERAGQRAHRLQAAKVLTGGQRALLPDALRPLGALHQLSQEEPEHPVQEMGANAAGAVQEAHHGVVWWRKPGARAASHPCCARLPVGIPLQTMTSLPFKVLIVLFLVSRRQFLPSDSKQECLVKPAHHVLEVKTVSPWLHIKASPCDCGKFKKRHYRHSQEQAASNWTGHDISTYITSRDSTCTLTERLLVLRKHENLENAALREIYRHSGAMTEIKVLVGSTGTALLETVVASLWRLEFQKYLKVDCGRTLGASTEWTCWRLQPKPLQAVVLGFNFVADSNTLMLNVYNTHECLPALMALTPLDVFLKSARSRQMRYFRGRQLVLESRGLVLSCTVCRGITPLIQPSLPGR